MSAPFTTFVSLERGGFADSWSPGEHPVAVRALGLLTIGEQVIDISYTARRDGVRTVVDAGGGTSGPLALVTGWQHTMAVSATEDGRTLYRDRLIFGAGILTPLLWPLYWAFWQWRGIQLRRLAPSFRVGR